MSMQVKPGYSAVQIALHWVIALLVVFQLVFGESMNKVLNAAERGRTVTPADQTLGSAHYWVGLVILALVALRLGMRLTRGVPEPAADRDDWMETAARISHWAFYALLVVVPVVGLLGYYLGDPFAEIHGWNKPVFIVLIAIHAVAALYHQYWLKDGTLGRMIRPV
jgi:cytochrome b561